MRSAVNGWKNKFVDKALFTLLFHICCCLEVCNAIATKSVSAYHKISEIYLMPKQRMIIVFQLHRS